MPITQTPSRILFPHTTFDNFNIHCPGKFRTPTKWHQRRNKQNHKNSPKVSCIEYEHIKYKFHLKVLSTLQSLTEVMPLCFIFSFANDLQRKKHEFSIVRYKRIIRIQNIAQKAGKRRYFGLAAMQWKPP